MTDAPPALAADPESPAAVLRRARATVGWTQSKLAEESGVPQSSICKYECGQRIPRADTMLRLLHIMGADESGTVDGPEQHAAELRERVFAHLQSQGFHVRDGAVLAPAQSDKDHLRRLHGQAVTVSREQARKALAGRESRLVARLAAGREIDPQKICPALVHIEDYRSQDSAMWRWCALHWSIPVSSGYGRRLRFLVVDEGHDDRVMGLIGLADPVFALKARDSVIGWSAQQRHERLACVMDAFVLGAVPPYSHLLAGKLAALLATSREVRDVFAKRYGHKTTRIAGRDPDAQLALVTTASALGRSSLYNRLRTPSGSLAFRPVGYTAGSGDFHFSGAIYEDLVAFAAANAPDGITHRHAKWGGSTSFRNRREVLSRAFVELGLNPKKMRLHGVQRQIFLAPLATNFDSWLRQEDQQLQWATRSTAELGQWWKDRWALTRAQSTTHWRSFDPDSWRLYT
ncbi:Druantia anti-phage system protein DruA [Kitasatospora sp. NPDC090308]|uniref:Druantia anti-phage system protein DruA n=1 Tax=Kitasatospora sp. NPDC090308 TaxID=3364082 RepID=UPI00381779D7